MSNPKQPRFSKRTLLLIGVVASAIGVALKAAAEELLKLINGKKGGDKG